MSATTASQGDCEREARACRPVLAKATSAGVRVLYPIQDQPYGDREVSLADPFGIVWFVATHLHD